MPTRRPTSGAAWLTLHLCDAHAKDAGLTEPSAPTHPLPPTFARAEHMYSSWRQLVLLEALAIVREGLRRCRKHERGLELALEGARGPERRGPPGLGALSFSSSSRVPSAEVRPGGVFLLTSCNNTAEELVRHFTSPNAAAWGGDGASPLAELDRVRYPTFQFGGVVGAAVATVAFRRAV